METLLLWKINWPVIDLILKGVVTGLILSVMIGPVFFVLLETSIRKGVKAAVAFDLGVLLNDVVYIMVAYIFYNQVADLREGSDNSTVLLIGGGLFTAYGIANFFKKVTENKIDSDLKTGESTKGYVLLVLKGFLLNLANPMVVFYWFSVMTIVAQDSSSNTSEYAMFIFLGTILITFFTLDFLKILGAKKLRPLVTQRRLMLLNRLIGIVFVVFGVVLIVQAIWNLVTKS